MVPWALREIEKFSDLFFTQRMGASWPLPCPLWVISRRGAVKVECPLSPRKLPRQSPTGAAVKGQKRTHAPQQFALLFDYFVGARKK
jgi:hypothetical protein